MRIWLSLIVAVLFCGMGFSQPSQKGKKRPPGPKLGQQAPDFELLLQDGKKKIKLSSFKDKAPVVLVFGSYT